MAAPTKQGLDYFPHDIGLMKDKKLRRPKLQYGALATNIYLSLLEMIYGDKGYYIEYGRHKDNVIWEILEFLQGKFQPDAETVSDVIEELVACELFSGDHYPEIITSKRVQRVYYMATVDRKAVEIDFSIWMLSEEEMKKMSAKSFILQNLINRPNNGVNRPINEVNRPINSQSKVKESKVKESKGEYIGADKPRTHFDPPTEEEVREYIESKGWQVDAARFVAFYESKGWMVGKTKMRDWRAAVKTWHLKDEERERGTSAEKAKREEEAEAYAFLDHGWKPKITVGGKEWKG